MQIVVGRSANGKCRFEDCSRSGYREEAKFKKGRGDIPVEKKALCLTGHLELKKAHEKAWVGGRSLVPWRRKTSALVRRPYRIVDERTQ